MLNRLLHPVVVVLLLAALTTSVLVSITHVPPIVMMFIVAASAASLIVFALLLTIHSPEVRFWPPGERTWKVRLISTCDYVFITFGVAVLILDWNSFIIPLGARMAGVGLFLIGFPVATVAFRQLGPNRSKILSGDLFTVGLYEFSRNPQILGQITATVGVILIANSELILVLGGLHVFWLVLLPYTEEPWLHHEHGDSYRTYANRVPRFIDWRKVIRLVPPLQ